MDLIVRADGTAQWRGRCLSCSIGHSGTRSGKVEGDGATPVGRYSLLRVLYRVDRVPPPVTQLPIAIIDRLDGWCDAPGDAQYNKPVRLPYPASAESLWRLDHLYDIVVVTSHNADPVVPGAGSAIFVHLRRPDHGPTEGCVAFETADLLEILAAWTAKDRLVIDPPERTDSA